LGRALDVWLRVEGEDHLVVGSCDKSDVCFSAIPNGIAHKPRGPDPLRGDQRVDSIGLGPKAEVETAR
jgi:hypothetical protein